MSMDATDQDWDRLIVAIFFISQNVAICPRHSATVKKVKQSRYRPGVAQRVPGS